MLGLDSTDVVVTLKSALKKEGTTKQFLNILFGLKFRKNYVICFDSKEASSVVTFRKNPI